MKRYPPRVEMLVVKKMLKDNAIGPDRSSGQTNLLIGPKGGTGQPGSEASRTLPAIQEKGYQVRVAIR